MFIEDYGGGRHVDKLAMWDQLTRTSYEAADNAMNDRFLVPNLAPEIGEATWKLVVRPLHLEVARPSQQSDRLHYNRYMTEDEVNADEILGLEYRLHSRANWETVRKAWRLLKLPAPEKEAVKNMAPNVLEELMSMKWTSNSAPNDHF